MADDDMSILDGAESADQRVMSIAGGTLVAYTCRSPDKETTNEDTLAAFEYGEDSAVLVVADGAGGLPAGKRASLTAVSELERSLQQSQNDTSLMRTAILNGIEAANQAVLDLGTGAATTLTVVGIEGRDVRAYHIGDSEALIVGQRGRIRSHTMSHSPTGFAVEAGLLDHRDALHHAERHLVSNFIGTTDMRIDVGAAVSMRTHDTVMLASDGLGDNVHLHEIIEIIRKGSLQGAVDQLVKLASQRMSAESGKQPSKPDDLSLILFRKPTARRKPGSGGAS